MIDFELTEEQKALIDTAKRFAKERIIPVAAECDRKSEFPKDVFKAGLGDRPRQPHAAAEYGGPGLSDLESAMITEELAYGCSGIQTSMTANTLGLTPIKLAARTSRRRSTSLAHERAGPGELRDDRAGRRQ